MAAYIPLRDDSFISLNERDFLKNLCRESGPLFRLDGRVANEQRPRQLHLSQSEASATAHVTISGGTRVMCLVKGRLGHPPNPDRPQQGAVGITVDLSPSASFAWSPMGTTSAGSRNSMPADDSQMQLSNRILRIAEALIGQVLDVEALCVTPGCVWTLECAITVIDASGGNVPDASIMSLLAALRHYRQPHVQENEIVPVHIREPTPLPLHHTPLTVTFGIIETKPTPEETTNLILLVDPNEKEGQVCESGITVGCDIHGQVCFVDFHGGLPVSTELMRQALTEATQHVRSLVAQLEDHLKKAEEQSRQESLRALQTQGRPDTAIPETPDDDNSMEEEPPVAYFAQQDGKAVDHDELKATDAADELYRLQVLEYNKGHQAQPLAQEKTKKPRDNSQLLAKMLASAGTAENVEKNVEGSQDTQRQAGKVETSRVEQEPATEDETGISSLAKEKPQVVDGQLESDEDVTMLAPNEFDHAAPADKEEAQSRKEVALDSTAEEPDDLAAAIKKKKKKKKSKK